MARSLRPLLLLLGLLLAARASSAAGWSHSSETITAKVGRDAHVVRSGRLARGQQFSLEIREAPRNCSRTTTYRVKERAGTLLQQTCGPRHHMEMRAVGAELNFSLTVLDFRTSDSGSEFQFLAKNAWNSVSLRVVLLKPSAVSVWVQLAVGLVVAAVVIVIVIVLVRVIVWPRYRARRSAYQSV